MATLTLSVNIAPDNIGTFQITLAEALTFESGQTAVSGEPPSGGTANYSIVIPDPS